MKDFLFDGPTSLVVTSISGPNAVLRELATQCKTRGLLFYLIGDVPSPSNFSLDGCEFYSLQRQAATDFEVAKLLPTRHYARKNIGYLLAMRSRSRCLIETDDDNMPASGFWTPREAKQRGRALSKRGWANVYQYFTEANIWPRGLPLDAIQNHLPEFDLLPEEDVDCPIQQGLADGNPDVDAIYRMILPLPISFRTQRQVALTQGVWSPFNSQNTTWLPKAYPLLYLPSYCSFRMTDIWRSLVAQRIAWENRWSVLYRSADVTQERNEHDLMKDFADEVPGYLYNRTIGERLMQLDLEAGTENIGENLISCYEELIRMAVVSAEEMNLVKAWIRDITALQQGGD